MSDAASPLFPHRFPKGHRFVPKAAPFSLVYFFDPGVGLSSFFGPCLCSKTSFLTLVGSQKGAARPPHHKSTQRFEKGRGQTNRDDFIDSGSINSQGGQVIR